MHPPRIPVLGRDQLDGGHQLVAGAFRNMHNEAGGNLVLQHSRIEVAQDDLVKLTVQSEDNAYSVTIDEYRVSRRVPAGGSTTLEFRADRAGTFAFYSNLTNDTRHAQMRGELVVRGR